MDFKITPATPDGININISLWVEYWEDLAEVMMEVERIENDEYDVSIPCTSANVIDAIIDAITDAKGDIRSDLAETHHGIATLNRRKDVVQ